MHREAPSRVRAAVGWMNDGGPDDEVAPVLPDGCMDIMWIDQQLVVCGADTLARAVAPTPGTKLGIRFAPGHLPGVLGLPADALVDQRVALHDLVDSDDARRAVGDAVVALTQSPRLEELEHLSFALGAGRASTAFEDAVADHAVAGTSVAAMADDLGLGARHLHRRCLAAFGYGPKVLSRVLRLQRALALGCHGSPPAEVAAVAGYADQSHLAREVRALTGTTWTGLASGRTGAAGARAQASGA